MSDIRNNKNRWGKNLGSLSQKKNAKTWPNPFDLAKNGQARQADETTEEFCRRETFDVFWGETFR